MFKSAIFAVFGLLTTIYAAPQSRYGSEGKAHITIFSSAPQITSQPHLPLFLPTTPYFLPGVSSV